MPNHICTADCKHDPLLWEIAEEMRRFSQDWWGPTERDTGMRKRFLDTEERSYNNEEAIQRAKWLGRIGMTLLSLPGIGAAVAWLATVLNRSE